MRNPGGIDGTGYLHGDGHSALQHRALYGHRHLVLVANLFQRTGLGPRLYDLVELTGGGQAWVGYVVQHAPGATVSAAECQAGLARMKELAAAGVFTVVAPGGFDHQDFSCPACNGNARGCAGPLPVHRLPELHARRYEKHLRQVAEEAAAASHFGDRSILRGGSYLYQAVPGLGLAAKRDPARRIPVLTRLLAEAGGGIEDRVVLDIGCNIGMMIGQYLSLGARWCHGWDRATVAPHTDKVLSALGCTRYSVSGGDISTEKDMAADLPPHVRAQLDGCVVSYLAVRLHLGWLDALGTLPWAYLIYEGHEGEDVAKTRQFLTEFQQRVPCEISGIAEYQDGDSDPRVVAVLGGRARPSRRPWRSPTGCSASSCCSTSRASSASPRRCCA
ncbi:MAG: hypothetical protein IPK12_24195 [Gemmatimonadetes bacterium]|nr:hypothetical protein [Gemmatimonadota bacterium]